MPDELRAIHFDLDPLRDDELSEAWTKLGFSRLTLERIECPDRRLTRAAVETVAGELADGETEVSVLLPDRKYHGIWGRLLHDRTSEAIERDLSKLAHANVTTVPFHFESRRAAQAVVTPAAVAEMAIGMKTMDLATGS